MDISTIASASAQNASQRASTQLNANFDTFLTLLTTQLQNQDPLAPLDTEKFTEQLVQFSAVEQSIQTNEYLEALIGLQTSSANETALAMVGKHASVDSNVSALGDSPAQWTYALPSDTASATALIRDANGAIIAEFDVAANAGAHAVNWNGKTASGQRASDGVYSLEIAAINASGVTVPASIQSTGAVSAATFNGDAPAIEIGGQLFPVSLVTRVDSTNKNSGVSS